MKKIIPFLISVAVIFCMSTAFAQNVIDTTLSETEEISMSIKNVSEIGTVSEKEAVFELAFDVKEKDYVKYNVVYQIDNDNPINAGTIEIEPGKKTVREFKLNVKNGTHTLKVEVYKNGILIKSFEESLAVMDKYKANFMDFYNPTGFCTHLSHYASDDFTKQTTNLKTFNLLEWSGANRIRDGLMPHRTEAYPGVYNFFGSTKWSKAGDSWTGWWLEKMIHSDYELYSVNQAPVTSTAYLDLPADVQKTAREARTTKAITSFAEFIVESLKNVPNIKAVEVWNEPNIANFWTSQIDVEVDYPNLLKQTALAIRDYSDDVRLDAFSVTDATFAWTDRCILYGAYPYFDAISYHPYAYHNDVEYKDTLFNKLWNVYEAIDRYGGWKEFTVTEIGQPTFLGNKLGEEEGAERTVKQLFMLDSFKVFNGHRIGASQIYILSSIQIMKK